MNFGRGGVFKTLRVWWTLSLVFGLVACGGQPTEDIEFVESPPTTTPDVPPGPPAPSIPRPVLTSINPTGPANNNEPTLFGAATPGSTVQIFRNSSCSLLVATTLADEEGDFSSTVTVPDNSITTFFARASLDGVSSLCSTSSLTYVEDSLALPPTGLNTSPLSPANNNSPQVLGTTEPLATVALYSDSNCSVDLASGSADESGQFAISINVADDSTTSIFAQVTDLAGNVSSCSTTPLVYVEDSTPPVVPTLTATNPASPANNSNPQVLGSTEALAAVALFSDATCTTLLASGSADGSGNFAIPITVADDSTTSIYGRAVDAAGNASGCSSPALVYEMLAPIDPPQLLSTSPLSPANNNSPQVLGTTEPNLTVTLYSDASCSTQIGSGSANSSGDFAIAITVADDSTTSIYGRASQGANVSACSTAPLVYVEDSTPPVVPTLTATNPASPANNSNPQVLGSTEALAAVALFSDATCTTLLASGSADGSGNFAIPITVADDSSTSIYARAVDAAGNASGCSSPALIYIEDSTPPEPPVLLGSIPALRSSLSLFEINGTAEALSQISLFSDSACTTLVASGSTNGAGDFSLNVTAPLNIERTYYAQATDVAGNTSLCSTTSVTYEAYSIPQGLGHFKGNQTNHPTEPDNFNPATAASINWSSADYDWNYYVHSTSSQAHQIQVKVGGHYSLSLNLPVTSTVAHTAVRSEVRINGVLEETGVTQSAYISRIGGGGNAHSASSNSLTILLDNLNANDVIEVRVLAHGAEATANISGQARLTLEYRSSQRPLFWATATRTTESTNLNQATAHPLEWSHLVRDSGYAHNNSDSPEEVILEAIGEYLVHVNLPLTGTVTDGSVRLRLRLNGSVISGGQAMQGYISNLSGHTSSSLHWSGLVRTTDADSLLTIDTLADAAAGTITVPTGLQGSLYIEKLAHTGHWFSAQGTRLVSDTDLNGAASPIQWSQAPIVDFSTFSHSTTTDSHQLVVEQDGDYRLYLNALALTSATNQRASLIVRVLVNGVAVPGAESSSFFLRTQNGHQDSSGTLNVYLRQLKQGDIITLTSERSAGNPTVTSPAMILSVEKKP